MFFFRGHEVLGSAVPVSAVPVAVVLAGAPPAAPGAVAVVVVVRAAPLSAVLGTGASAVAVAGT